jgi:hypothetical protein
MMDKKEHPECVLRLQLRSSAVFIFHVAFEILATDRLAAGINFV